MSKRAEIAALEAYPDTPLPHLGDGIIAKQGHLRNVFQEGYEQAEKDTIERAVNVLINLPSLVIPSNYIAYFRKKMMEE